jgi:putative oxygen-independent coproporphyrinogen III oxidase
VAFSLYIHIPYCLFKCPYCDFNSYAVTKWPEEEYVHAVITEMTHRAAQPPLAEQSAKTIFIGGGTPSLFGPGSIARLIETADRLFGIERGAEITIEANPGTVDADKLGGFRAAGVNRISFGAQSFKPAILAFLGRIHSPRQTREAAGMAHRAGFDRLNLDLIFAVPGQTLDDVRRDIEAAAALGPDHISAYNLTFEEGTAFFGEWKRGRIRPLENDEQAVAYAAVREELARRGYPMYEISNYAPSGHESRHNLTYWRAETYLGVGAGAHSYAREPRTVGDGDPEGSAAGRRRWWNERNPVRYIELALATGAAEAGSETIDLRTAIGEFVFLNLRLCEGFAAADFQLRFGESFDTIFGERTAHLFEGGLLVRDADRIRLTTRGLELADSVFAELF